MSGSAEQAVANLGLSAEETETLAMSLTALEDGRDVNIAIRRVVDRQP